jgi:4a-hydroxytetrahydrobiopterin dehydratase
MLDFALQMEVAMKREKLSPSEIEAALQELDGWILSDSGVEIRRSFVFENFVSAFGFMTEAAIHAEKIDHHPEWTNVYRKVDVALTTHSAKGLTGLDFDLAAFMDKAARRH